MSDLQSASLCKLCDKRPVGSQASHIIPKFFTKSIYFKNGRNQGMKTMKFVKGIMGEVENNWEQDGLKQKYLFCSDCEKYFELLDTHFSNEIYNQLEKSKENNNRFLFFTLKHKVVSCEKANENIVALFIISLFLRCHISYLPFCKSFQFTNNEFQNLQKKLNQYCCLKHTELETKFTPKSLADLFSYLIFTHDNNSKIDNTENFVEANYRSNVGIYYLVANNYVFTLYLQQPLPVFSESLNTNNEKVKIIMLPDDKFDMVRKINLEKHIPGI